MYLLHTAPCFLSTLLAVFDEELKRILNSVFNISLAVDENTSIQASLPVRFGGLGVRSAVHLAPSAFPSSVAGSNDLV